MLIESYLLWCYLLLRKERGCAYSQESIERFHSRDQQPYWVTTTKDDSRTNGLVHKLTAVSLLWNTNMAAMTSYALYSCQGAVRTDGGKLSTAL